MAQVWFQPALALITPVTPGTSTGVALFTVVPLPSCPWEFKPQQSILPGRLATTAQA